MNVGIESGQLITKSKDKGDCGRKNIDGTLEGCVHCVISEEKFTELSLWP